ncbi:hypothetical protein [uncultured Eubacterium sp.]|uniref:hypothetical protein n=1 Tax=uncultured Eubacterium sp. TaxID=165185 RepID=UPI000E889F85|nr:hypothetical protein [uncultured Eubacterium sp.]HAH18145.1 hypothetical protein [Eubacterium sp.]HAV91245.1 hypothetical protein [Eubacterium sp.]
MFYKSKRIRQLYMVEIKCLVGGLIFAIIGLILFSSGLIQSSKAVDGDLSKIIDVFKDSYVIYLLLGGMLTVMGLTMFGLDLVLLICAKNIKSISGITQEDIDKVADDEDSVLLAVSKVLLSKDFMVGFRCDVGAQIFDQVAFKYDEVKKIYGEHVKSAYGTTKYEITVEATDDNKYVLSTVYNSKYEMERVEDDIKAIQERIG